MNNADLEKSIDLVEKVMEEKKIIYMPDFTQLQVYKDHKDQFESIMPDLIRNSALSKSLTSMFQKFLFSPFLLATGLLRKLAKNSMDRSIQNIVSAAAVSTSSNEMALSAPSKEKNEWFLEVILEVVQEKADTVSFGKKVRDYSYRFDTLKEFAEKADIDYTYLNKLINDKLRPDTTVSRDLTIKICLALELDLLEANELMSLAGYVLCGNTKRDRILSICVQHKVGVMTTNQLLSKRNLPLLSGAVKKSNQESVPNR